MYYRGSRRTEDTGNFCGLSGPLKSTESLLQFINWECRLWIHGLIYIGQKMVLLLFRPIYQDWWYETLVVYGTGCHSAVIWLVWLACYLFFLV